MYCIEQPKRIAGRRLRQALRRVLPVALIGWSAVPVTGQEPAPAQKPSASVAEEEPDSYKEDLGEKLLRKTVTGADEDLMAQILRLMHESSRKLSLAFDPGAQTQQMQTTIMERLDEAIKVAAAQQQRSRGQAQSAGDKRRQPDAGKADGSKPGETESGAGSATDSSDSTQPGVVTENPERRGGPLSERRRTWGNLPARDREEVIQGSGEGFLERYRLKIERYYRALQEADE